jgi:hypothetical protein
MAGSVQQEQRYELVEAVAGVLWSECCSFVEAVVD